MTVSVVYKYKLKKVGETVLEMPVGAEVLCLQLQYGEPVIWALVDKDAPTMLRKFQFYATGEPLIPPMTKANYIGTCQVARGELIFHLFETTE